MIFGLKHWETAKLGSQRITVKSSQVGYLAESSINGRKTSKLIRIMLGDVTNCLRMLGVSNSANV